jgi:hypothetical protein
MPDKKPKVPKGPQVPTVVGFAEAWSAIVPGNFGLQAGVMRGDAIVFRPILGWVTVTSRRVDSSETMSGFHSVVLSDVGHPVLLDFVAGNVGVFSMEMSEEQALALKREWEAKKEQQSSPGSLLN